MREEIFDVPFSYNVTYLPPKARTVVQKKVILDSFPLSIKNYSVEDIPISLSVRKFDYGVGFEFRETPSRQSHHETTYIFHDGHHYMCDTDVSTGEPKSLRAYMDELETKFIFNSVREMQTEPFVGNEKIIHDEKAKKLAQIMDRLSLDVIRDDISYCKIGEPVLCIRRFWELKDTKLYDLNVNFIDNINMGNEDLKFGRVFGFNRVDDCLRELDRLNEGTILEKRAKEIFDRLVIDYDPSKFHWEYDPYYRLSKAFLKVYQNLYSETYNIYCSCSDNLIDAVRDFHQYMSKYAAVLDDSPERAKKMFNLDIAVALSRKVVETAESEGERVLFHSRNWLNEILREYDDYHRVFIADADLDLVFSGMGV